MHRENPLWGAPRIHGELLMLGIQVSESTVSNYLGALTRGRPSQGWRTLLRNHLHETIAVDFAIVPTIRFKLLFVFVVLDLVRCGILQLGVTAHPTAQWTDAPEGRARVLPSVGDIVSIPEVGRLHHRYDRGRSDEVFGKDSEARAARLLPAIATGAAAIVLTRLRLVYLEVTAVELALVEGADGGACASIVHLDETEAA
jgi:hypothetical protein